MAEQQPFQYEVLDREIPRAAINARSKLQENLGKCYSNGRSGE